MNKKFIVLVILVAVLAVGLTACNTKTYKQDAIAVEYLDQPVENNGGLTVKQGNYLYYINAYAGADAENAFGAQTKTCLMRATLNDDGSVIEDSRVVIVPKNIYSGSTKAGIYIYKNWIYYATPNMDKTKSGTVNTVYLDFYRTSIDRSKTELLFTINGRSADYTFTDSAILVVADSNVYKIDLNKKNANKINDKKNYVSVLERASALTRIYADNAFGDYTFVLQNAPDEESYLSYNNLLVLDKTGASTTVIGKDTFGDNKYTVAVLDYVTEADGGLTVFYTKTRTNDVGTSIKTLNCYKFADTSFTFDATKEKQLVASYNGTSVKGLSYADGALVTSSALPYLHKVNGTTSETLCDSDFNAAITIKAIQGGYVYYTASSSATAMYRFAMTGASGRVAEKVCDINLLSTWIGSEVVGNYMYYLDGKSNYIFRVKLADKQTAEVFGVMTDADKEAYEKAE